MGFVDKDGAEKKDKSNQETTGEKAQRKLQEQKELCKKWMNEMVRLIGELTLQLNKYNKEKDDRGGTGAIRSRDVLNLEDIGVR